MPHNFCRCYLDEVMLAVNENVPKDRIEQAYAFKNSCGYEFHGPQGFYLFLGNKVDCLWAAKAEGWDAYLESLENANK